MQPLRLQDFVTAFLAAGVTVGAITATGAFSGTSLTATGAISGATVVASTSVGSPVILAGTSLGAPAITATTSLSVGSSGTAVDGIWRSTTAVNFAALLPGITGTSNVTVTGASVGDDCQATVTSGDLWSTTSTGVLSCRVTATNTVTLSLYNATSTSAFDAGPSAVSVRVTSY